MQIVRLGDLPQFLLCPGAHILLILLNTRRDSASQVFLVTFNA
jgi:hypothetical protein